METNIINVKYEDKFSPKCFSGKSYSYYTNTNVDVGDLVLAPTSSGDKIAIVSKINIPENSVVSIKPYLKTIIKKLSKEKYLNEAA